MRFNKTNEEIIRLETWSYFKLRDFHFEKEKSDENILEEFMKSRYFVWKEEFQNQVLATVNKRETYVDWNFHGLYDVKKLSPSDFETVQFYTFKNKLMKVVMDEIREDQALKQIEQIIDGLFDCESLFLTIKNLTQDKFHDWSVFDFFISGFVINTRKNSLKAVEFGLE